MIFVTTRRRNFEYVVASYPGSADGLWSLTIIGALVLTPLAFTSPNPWSDCSCRATMVTRTCLMLSGVIGTTFHALFVTKSLFEGPVAESPPPPSWSTTPSGWAGLGAAGLLPSQP